MQGLSSFKHVILPVLLAGSTAQLETPLDTPPLLTDHQKYMKETTIDFTGIDFTGDASTAAALAVDTMAAEMKNVGRFKELFENAITPECRALISKHFGYFLKAIATETPLPFASTKFESSCEDEHPWDFNNLPKDIHMGHVQLHSSPPAGMPWRRLIKFPGSVGCFDGIP